MSPLPTPTNIGVGHLYVVLSEGHKGCYRFFDFGLRWQRRERLVKTIVWRSKSVKSFSKEELARYNGKNGAPAYIAYKEKVYDVSTSFQWRNGRHQVLHNAGEDLTESLEQAPHSEELLGRFPVIGILREE